MSSVYIAVPTPFPLPPPPFSQKGSRLVITRYGTDKVEYAYYLGPRASLKYNIARLDGLCSTPPPPPLSSSLSLPRSRTNPSSRVPVIRAVFTVMHFAEEEGGPSLRS